MASAGLVAFFEDGFVVVVGGDLVEHGGGGFVEVDVGPFEAEDFASPGAAGGKEGQGVAVSDVAEPVEEAAHLLRGPCVAGDAVRLARFGHGRCVGDVAENALPAVSIAKRFGENAVDHGDCSC